MKTFCISFVLILSGLISYGNTFPVVAKDSTASMQKVADGVYVIIHEHATDEWPHGNTGVVVGDNSVFVIDACY